MAHSPQRSGYRVVPGEGQHDSPFMGEQVKFSIQLAHRDGLGVQHVVVDGLIHTATDGRLSFQRGHGGCQDSVTLGRQPSKSEAPGSPEHRAGVGCRPQGAGGVF